MKLGREIPDLTTYVVELVTERLLREVLDAVPVNPKQAEMIVIARLMNEFPKLTTIEDREEPLGALVAGHLLKGGTLTIDAGPHGIRLIMDDEIVSDALLRRTIDYNTFGAIHGEWWFEVPPEDRDYEMPGNGTIRLSGDDSAWKIAENATGANVHGTGAERDD